MVLTILFGSTGGPAAKIALRELPMAWMPTIRFGGAGLVLLLLLWPRRAQIWRMMTRDWPLVLLSAALCVPVNQFCFLNGTKLSSISHVGVFYAACPLVVFLLAWLTGLERMRMNRAIGITLSVGGVGLIGWTSLAHAQAVGDASSFWGDILLVFAVLSWGGYLVVSKPLVCRHGALPVLFGTFTAGALLNVPWSLSQIETVHGFATASWTSWAAFGYIFVFTTLLVLSLQNVAMRRLDASQVTALGNMSPILSIVWAALFFGDALTPELVVGATLTVGGAIWANRPERSAVLTGPGLGKLARVAAEA